MSWLRVISAIEVVCLIFLEGMKRKHGALLTGNQDRYPVVILVPSAVAYLLPCFSDNLSNIVVLLVSPYSVLTRTALAQARNLKYVTAASDTTSRTCLSQGENVPPPIRSFREMKLPDPMLAALEAKGIKRPTPIQVNAGRRDKGTENIFSSQPAGIKIPVVAAMREIGYSIWFRPIQAIRAVS